ncbi:protein of unknown function [Acidithiobacillus ferrivorans]|uniref:Uncharacterized protein n=1 Tax=Acidithiobacillus ferrivorans TaxID=160808 RepID=A0A060UPY8_9PROT|nr:hypothetical protein [Acidithiobacillus ferrivorans]CDQ10687.1 hypothetical protein AFERRI_400468 [Acidithiobacillus ferrivorans]SMH64714.1 protein of unknown function [Acidithiobacillus ferrivorans]
MEQTRFKANGKPVYITKIGSYVFSHPDGKKEEVLGMGSFSILCEKVDVFDDGGTTCGSYGNIPWDGVGDQRTITLVRARFAKVKLPLRGGVVTRLSLPSNPKLMGSPPPLTEYFYGISKNVD